MPIQDDFTIDYVDRKITYNKAFVFDRPPFIYTVNEFYSFLQDTFDEPAQMDDPVPMSAQTPTQYTLINKWFMDDESMKALYGGSIQTSGWTYSDPAGITQIRWTSATSAPTDPDDIGKAVTGDSSGATGIILAVSSTVSNRDVVWIRNTNEFQFTDGEVIDDDATGLDPDFTAETNDGVQSGETIWSNLFSVGSLQSNTEIYIGQEDDYQGGAAYHTATAYDKLERRIEKIDEWWDSDVDFFTNSPNLLGGAGHFDILVKTTEAGDVVDDGRLFAGARQFSKVYSHFEFVGGAGNFVVPFASTGADLNSADGPYTVAYDNGNGTAPVVGDVLEDTASPNRLRAVVTEADGGDPTGTISFYLIGENEPLVTQQRTLLQLADNDAVQTSNGSGAAFDINGAPTQVLLGPAVTQGIVITFADAQRDTDEDSTDEEYSCVINCNNVNLSEVYQRTQFLTSRGNQDGTSTDVQDTLLPSGKGLTLVPLDAEAGEFYRAVGDITVPWDNAGAGTIPIEGTLVVNQDGAFTASGVIVSISGTTSGQLTLTQVKGTWADNDTVAIEGGVATTDFVTINGTPSTIVDNTAAPFGAFAGGRWFVAQGVVLDNVPPGDANNWETVDLDGTRRAPPAVRVITFAGLITEDRGFIAEVTSIGTDVIDKAQNGVASGGTVVGDFTFELDATVKLNVPAVNSWVRIVDVDSPTSEEYRFFFTTVSGTTVTFDTGANTSGDTTSGTSATVLTDSGAFASFGVVGAVRIGMQIRNINDGSRAIVVRKIDDDSIETTPLAGGTNNLWFDAAATDAWEANTVVVALDAADTVYFPFIDDVVPTAATTLTASVKYVVPDVNLIARARFSSPDIGGQRILPFQQLGVLFQDADLTVTAIRTDDTIAS